MSLAPVIIADRGTGEVLKRDVHPAQVLMAAPAGASLASVSAIYDGGLFIGAPSAVLAGLLAIPTSVASVTLTLGSAVGTYRLQPAP